MDEYNVVVTETKGRCVFVETSLEQQISKLYYNVGVEFNHSPNFQCTLFYIWNDFYGKCLEEDEMLFWNLN